MPNYVASIGMEVHAELLTQSKMFCRCPVAFGGEPNTRVCPVCLGMPGALPVPNKRAIEFVIRTALALNCQINMSSEFNRKNYFYPDLSKGYQISQYAFPIGHTGYLDIPKGDGVKRIHIRRVHLEEDTGKLMHLPSGGSGVDFNRSGVPLMEIVTEFPPDIADAEEAKEYLVQLRQILLYLDVTDGKMEEGSLRCEPNISIRPEGQPELGTKTELKNLNSFRAVQLGVGFELKRQEELIESGGKVLQETRGWNEQGERSFAMRTKETENDYRYFPDPDLAPMSFDQTWIEEIRTSIPELPLAKSMRYQREWALPKKHAEQLAGDKDWAAFFEQAVESGGNPKAVCNLMISDFAAKLNEDLLLPNQSKVTPKHLVELTKLIEDGTISGKMAKDIFVQTYQTGDSPRDVVQAKGVTQISDQGALGDIVKKVLVHNSDVVAKYRAGQTAVKGFLVGQVMKESNGRANPKMVQELVEAELEKI